ncbi:hypothetical protein DFH29DRAFT_925870 [Suillus ampliporus]|nr:hypothetical protein DFH29DRAFT_925870 [Suillus ampliporus]
MTLYHSAILYVTLCWTSIPASSQPISSTNNVYPPHGRLGVAKSFAFTAPVMLSHLMKAITSCRRIKNSQSYSSHSGSQIWRCASVVDVPITKISFTLNHDNNNRPAACKPRLGDDS